MDAKTFAIADVEKTGMISVNYQMSLEEQLRTALRRKLLRPRFLLAVLITWCGGTFLLIASGGQGAFFLAGVCFVVYPFVAQVMLYLLLRRILTKFSWFTAPTIMSFGDAGLAIACPEYRSELGWSQFRAWSQSENHFFLFLDAGNTAVTIPKRAFSPEQLQAFMAYLARIQL